MYTNGCPWDETTFAFAAMFGNMEVLKYMHTNGCPWGASCTASACNLEVTKYLHENGCPWDMRAYERAATYGRLDVIDYLYTNGCPLDIDACVAVARDQPLVLEYLHDIRG